MSYGLTKRQVDLLGYLKSCEEAGLPSPSYEEMRAALGLRSKQNVKQLLDGLQERGAIRRLPYRRRTVRLTREVGAPLPDIDPDNPMQAEVVDLVSEAKRHARHELGADDGQCTAHVLAVWLWCALHGTSPGFLPKPDASPPVTVTAKAKSA